MRTPTGLETLTVEDYSWTSGYSSFAILWMGMTVSMGILQLWRQFSHVYNAFLVWYSEIRCVPNHTHTIPDA